MLNHIYHIIATVGFAGYFPYAPGTVGTAAGVLFLLILKPADPGLLFIIVPLFVIGTLSAHNTERVLGKDSGRIVIDEFCGYLISVAFLPRSLGYLIAAFFLFRFFDIVKPPPVRHAEQYFFGGVGIMLDDVLAGVYTNLCLQLWSYLFS